jgi:polyphosphate kinase
MGKNKHKQAGRPRATEPELELDGKDAKKAAKREYEREQEELWIALVGLHKQIIAGGRRVLVILEGRDAAGKDGAIKRIVEHLSPREYRVVALGKPTDRERGSWYYQRWIEHLPAAGELVLFNRSWYNRAGVEVVMGFCTPTQRDQFLAEIPQVERLLISSGVELVKYYLDLSKPEQAERMQDRRENPLTQWKISPIDAVALEKFGDYTKARDKMLLATSSKHAPWTIVQADDKRQARLNIMRDLLARLSRDKCTWKLTDAQVLRAFEPSLLKNFLAR